MTNVDRRLGTRHELAAVESSDPSHPEHVLRAALSVTVIERGENPTTDFYVTSRVDPGRLIRCDLRREPRPEDLPDGSLVIFVRYSSRRWRAAVRQRAAALRGVVLLVDDDMNAVLRDRTVPLRWRFRVLRHHHAGLAGLRNVCDAVWTSTPRLAARYSGSRMLGPALDRETAIALTEGRQPEAETPTLVFAGTASHRNEFDFVMRVARPLLAERPRLRLLVCGAGGPPDDSVPQCVICPQTSWAEYRRFALKNPGSVFLAPMSRSPLNEARSETKRFDAARFRAAGIFAAGSRAAETVRDGVDGLVLPRDEAAWRRAAASLLDDHARRREIVEAARISLLNRSGLGTQNTA